MTGGRLQRRAEQALRAAALPALLASLVVASGCDDATGEAAADARVDSDAQRGPADAAGPDATVEGPDAAIDAPDAGEDAGPAPDAAPDAGPPPLVIDDPVPATPEALSRAAILALVAVGPALITERDDGIYRGEQRLAGDATGLTGAARIDDTLVVAADGRLYVEVDAALVASPLGDPLPPVVDVAVVDDTLWLATTDGLFLWQDGSLRPVTPAGLPAGGAALAVDADGLWVGAGDATYRLAGDPLVALQTAGLPAAGTVAVDGGDAAWTIVDDTLWRLGDDLWWQPVDLPFAPSGAAAGLAAPGVWLLAPGALWHLRDGHLRQYQDAPAAGTLAVDVEGGALLAGAAGLWRVPLGRLVSVDVPPGLLLADGVATIRPSLPERVARVAATVDGAPVDVAGAWQVTLSPAALSRGAHTLAVTVTWDDAVEARAEARFASQVTTWAEDVHPIAVRQCGMCHGQGAAARPLYASEHWRPQIDRILDAVRTGRMPLGRAPLTAAEVELLDAWRAAGMPEEWP
ncbi:MAG: hypothetical protein R3F43_23770 [bacterium]